MERHSISKEEHWREGYGFDSVAKDVDHEEWEEMASEFIPHDCAQFALLGERLLPLADGQVESEIKPPSAEALGHLETAIEKCQRLCQHVKKISIKLSKYINTKIYKGEQIEDLGTLEQQKAFVLERTQLPKLQEMMVLNARPQLGVGRTLNIIMFLLLFLFQNLRNYLYNCTAKLLDITYI